MRPKMKFNQNKILLVYEKNSVYIIFHCGPNEIQFRFGDGRRETAH